MPKVKVHSKYINGNRVEVDVKYGNDPRTSSRGSSRMFFIQIPEYMRQFAGERFVTAATEEGVVNEFNELAAKFFSVNSTVTKVIKLKMNIDVFKEGKDPNGFYARWSSPYCYKEDIKEPVFPEQRLDIAYAIGYIHEVGGKYFFSTKETLTADANDVHDPWRKSRKKEDRLEDKYLIWTPERQLWIESLYNQFTLLLNKCLDFYQQSDKKITELIDSQQKLLTN